MPDVAIRKADQLPENVRSAVELLLGRPIAPDEEISVIALPPQEAPSVADRAQTAKDLEAFLHRRAQKVGEIPDNELDAVIDDAASHARRHP